VTETEWAACREPEKMLTYLRDAGGASDRKLRLFAVAVCRRIWPLLTDQRSRKAIEVAEDWAEGRASEGDLAAARAQAEAAANDSYWQARYPGTHPEHVAVRATLAAAQAVCSVVEGTAYGEAAAQAARAAAHQAAAAVLFAREDDPAAERASQAAQQAQEAGQAALLRDIFGNPFAAGPRLDAVLRWNDSCVVRIAEGIYREKAFERVGVLHDALLDAGLDSEAVLSHLREPIHARGCFVIDLLLGKS